MGRSALTDICFVFMVHQPFRLNRNFLRDLFELGRLTDRARLEKYFDHSLNREVFERVAQRCYLPANEAILEAIDRHRDDVRRVEVAYSLSGVFLEQCERYRPDVLESFRSLAETGCVEFLNQTYYHSLASLFSASRGEFIEQVKMHRELIRSVFKYEAKTFENTELIYNNSIAATVRHLGFEVMLIEGAARALGGRPPNYLYRAKSVDLRLLPRNYQLSDDIGFRFSSRSWEEWPLLSEKYAAWLSATPGECINIFLDYE
ncbi:MAG: glycoside hydrolase family 57 protein, partial [Candidatus Bathyarchaeia archaeon]